MWVLSAGLAEADISTLRSAQLPISGVWVVQVQARLECEVEKGPVVLNWDDEDCSAPPAEADLIRSGLWWCEPRHDLTPAACCGRGVRSLQVLLRRGLWHFWLTPKIWGKYLVTGLLSSTELSGETWPLQYEAIWENRNIWNISLLCKWNLKLWEWNLVTFLSNPIMSY